MNRITRRGALVLAAIMLTAFAAIARVPAASARPWLGVVTQALTGDLREGLDLPDAAGVLVNRVVAGGPADKAGLRKGDVIVRLNSRAVESPAALARMVGDAREDQEVALQVLRGGDTKTIPVVLGTWSGDDTPFAPEAPPAPAPPGDDDEKGDSHRDMRVRIFGNGEKPEVYRFDGDVDKLPGHVREMLRDMPGLDGNGGLHALRVMGAGRGRLGVRIESLNDGLAAALGAPGTDGVLVLEVMKDTPAERAGLGAGDVILTADGHDVKNAEGLVQALRDVDGKVSLTVLRKGSRRTVEAELAATPRKMRWEGSMAAPGRRGDSKSEDRIRLRGDAGGDDLRQQLEELRQQLRELRQQLKDDRKE